MRIVGYELVTPAGRRLRVEAFVGAGAFGEVYRAVEAATAGEFAIKALRLAGLANEIAQRTLLNEARLATEIDHDNVVKVFEAGEDVELGLYLVMEYLSGGTLKDLLENRHVARQVIPMPDAIGLMSQIAVGGRAVNERLIHRDIKPDNILLSDGRLKIGDFGISKIVQERTRTRSFKGVGPIAYMAPEAWRGDPNTVAIDIYSVGIVFYEILTLQHPFDIEVTTLDPFSAWRDAHLHTLPSDVRDFRSDTSPWLAQMISRMLAKRPADRPGWDEIVTQLSRSEDSKGAQSDTGALVERAIARHRQVISDDLSRKREAELRLLREKTYETSFAGVVALLDGVVREFNAGFQGGRIEKHGHGRALYYELPNAPRLDLVLFNRRDTEQALQSGKVGGGAFLGLKGGISANLVWVTSDADPYGTWIGCLVSRHAIAHPNAFERRRFVTPEVPLFGFSSEEEFYEEIYWAGGGMHIFKYDFWPDVRRLFWEILDTAFKG